MSKQQIPHLSTFLSSRSNKARAKIPPKPQDRETTSLSAVDDDHHYQGVGGVNSDTDKAKDKIVQDTDRDATISRLSAVERGYLDDPFASQFLLEGEKPQRRFPIINRGTYVRTYAIDLLVKKFLADDDDEPSSQGKKKMKKKKQIISLGAGSDTRYFRLMTSRPSSSSSSSIVYHELDFPTNTAQKIQSIKRSPSLLSVLQSQHPDIQISPDHTSLISPSYNIHPIDLRTLHDENSSNPYLPNLDPTLPTLLLSECCLIYLPPSDADSILKYFTSHLFPPQTPVGMIIYEPINPSDSFGRVMVQNLARRGIVLQTLKRYASLGRQRERLRVMGFDRAQGAADVHFIWENWVNEREKERVARLEMLDEVEEWRLLAEHYCVAWGWREGTRGEEEEEEEGENDVFKLWREEVVGQLSDE